MASKRPPTGSVSNIATRPTNHRAKSPASGTPWTAGRFVQFGMAVNRKPARTVLVHGRCNTIVRRWRARANMKGTKQIYWPTEFGMLNTGYPSRSADNLDPFQDGVAKSRA